MSKHIETLKEYNSWRRGEALQESDIALCLCLKCDVRCCEGGV